MMSDRDVWVKAGAIAADHGTLTAKYIISSQLGDVIDDNVAVDDWRSVATAADTITNAVRQ